MDKTALRLLVSASLTPILVAGLYLAFLIHHELFVSPLSRYPGPLLARISSIHNFICAYKKNIHLDIFRQHKIYGDVLRYSSNRLCFSSSQAYRDIYMLPTLRKSDAYDQHHPLQTKQRITFTTTDLKEATRLRRLLAPAFSNQTLKAFEDKAAAVTTIFCQILLGNSRHDRPSNRWSDPVDVGELSFYFTLDLVIRAIFPKNLNLMRQSQHRWLASALLDGNHYMYLHFAWPNLFGSKLCTWLGIHRWLFPNMAAQSRKFDEVFEDLYQSLASFPPEDGFYSAICSAKDPSTGEHFPEEEIRKELKMLTRAGADTMSVAISVTLHYLAFDLKWQRRVAREIRNTFSSYEEIRPGEKLDGCLSLAAAILESLRLGPAVPGSFWRVLMEDTMIDGHLVRRGTEVGVCQYAIHHSERYFPEPFRFQPERFLPQEASKFPIGGVKASNPFSLGPRACPARNFAMLQVTLCLARTLWLADLRPSQSGSSLDLHSKEGDIPEYPLGDIFTSEKKGPVLESRLREGIACPWDTYEPSSGDTVSETSEL